MCIKKNNFYAEKNNSSLTAFTSKQLYGQQCNTENHNSNLTIVHLKRVKA